MSLRVLLFAYYFPPSAGPGVRRTVRFLKELPRLGVEPIVVTVEAETYRNREEFGLDEASLSEIPAGVRVERVPAWSLPRLRGALMRLGLMRLALIFLYPLFWERQALWVIPAIRRGLRLIREVRPDVVYTTTGPFCTNLIGLLLRRWTGVPWVTDYRDLWTQSWGRWWPTRAHHEIERALERLVLRRADRVIANTPTARSELLREFPGTRPECVDVITNGWDRLAIEAGPAPDGPGRVVLLHTGSFLQRGEPPSPPGALRRLVRSGLEYRLGRYDRTTHGPATLFAALVRLRAEDPDLAGRLLLRLVGNVHESWAREAARLGIADLVEFSGRRPFSESRRLQREADLLVLTTVSRRDRGPVPVVNAKLYEYLSAGRPILVLSHEGDAAEFARHAGLGIVVDPRDVDGVTALLRRLAEEPGAVLGGLRPRPEVVDGFSSRALAERLVLALRAVL